MKHHAAEIGAAGIDRGRQQEIQRQMMHGNRDGAGEDRAVVAIGDQAGQRGEEVHVHIDLPGMPDKLIGEHRHPTHQRDGEGQAGRKAIARTGPRRGRRDRHRRHHGGRRQPAIVAHQADRKREGDVKPQQPEQRLAGGLAQCGEIVAFNSHSRIPQNAFTKWPACS